MNKANPSASSSWLKLLGIELSDSRQSPPAHTVSFLILEAKKLRSFP
ncbi:MAG: hypothetical protein Q8O52_29920 [Sulfuritalea sp.]|nr:hypothetical protein [Sulfuritalea sp.]